MIMFMPLPVNSFGKFLLGTERILLGTEQISGQMISLREMPFQLKISDSRGGMQIPCQGRTVTSLRRVLTVY